MFKQFSWILALSVVFCGGGEANINANLACGKSSLSKLLTMTNPSSNIPTSCVYTIRAKSLSVCQLRVDFTINLLPPTIPSATNNIQYIQCMDDVLQIGNFRLCGVDTDQHIYIPFNRTAGEKEKVITITTAARSGGVAAPSWNLRVTQLECSLGSPLRSFAEGMGSFMHKMLPESIKTRALSEASILGRTFYMDGFKIAPNGCTQYFPEASGSFSSFNYNNGNGFYPGNMNYAICFRRQVNTQILTLTPKSFQIGFEPAATGLVDASCVSQIKTDGRSEDYMMIPQSTMKSTGARAFYYCGNVLNTETVTTNVPGPISIVFNADSMYADGVAETGFKFDYTVA